MYARIRSRVLQKKQRLFSELPSSFHLVFVLSAIQAAHGADFSAGLPAYENWHSLGEGGTHACLHQE